MFDVMLIVHVTYVIDTAKFMSDSCFERIDVLTNCLNVRYLGTFFENLFTKAA